MALKLPSMAFRLFMNYIFLLLPLIGIEKFKTVIRRKTEVFILEISELT